MAKFTDLSRELRDMIYLELLSSRRAFPCNNGQKFMLYDPTSRFKKIYEPSSSLRGEFGCAYSLEPVPPTCAGFMGCSRQINGEMTDMVKRLERKGELNVRLDCIAEDESWFWWSWGGIPLVSTTTSPQTPDARGWIEELGFYMRRLFSQPWSPKNTSTTRIPRLWIDIRIVGDRANKWRRNNSPAERTGWAVCAALKRLFDKGAYLPTESEQSSKRVASVDELILNVVSPRSSPTLHSPTGVASLKTLPEDFPLDAAGEGTVHSRTVAKELVDVWTKIWAGDEFKGIFYSGLLEKIGWVKICVDGETFRVRELRGVLERGQKERRRIASRGW